MNTPKRPPGPPKDGAEPATNSDGKAAHGIPAEMEENEPAGLPTSDRHQAETVVKKS